VRISFVWRAFFEIHSTVLCKVLDVCNSLLKGGRPLLHSLLQPGRFALSLSNRVIAVKRITRQNDNRDWVSFIEPKQNRAFKLPDCGLVFVYNKDTRTRIGLRFSTFRPHEFNFLMILAGLLGKKLYVTQNRGPASNSNTEKWGTNFRQREVVGYIPPM